MLNMLKVKEMRLILSSLNNNEKNKIGKNIVQKKMYIIYYKDIQ